MKIKKISSIVAMSILLMSFGSGCGKQKELAGDLEEKTEIVLEDSEMAATEAVNEIETELETETEIDEPVLFKIIVTNPDGAYVGDQPSEKEYSRIAVLEYGKEFEAYQDFKMRDEAGGYYGIRTEDGQYWYISKDDAQIIE